MTSTNLKATLTELDRISSTAGDKGSRHSLVHFLSQIFTLLSDITERGSAKHDCAPDTKVYRTALVELLDKLSKSQDLPTTICTALQLTAQKTGKGQDSLISLLKYLWTQVPPPCIVALTTAICCGWHIPTSSPLVNLATATLVRELQDSSTLSSLSYPLRQFISFALLSIEVSTDLNFWNYYS